MRFPTRTFRRFPVPLLALGLFCTAATVAHAKDLGKIGDLAGDIVDASNVKGGLVVVLGCEQPDLVASLRVNESYLVQGLETDPAKVNTARKSIRAAGIYGQVTTALYDGKLGFEEFGLLPQQASANGPDTATAVLADSGRATFYAACAGACSASY